MLYTDGGVMGRTKFGAFSCSGVVGGVPSYIGRSTEDWDDFKDKLNLLRWDFFSAPPSPLDILAGRVANLDSLGCFLACALVAAE